MSGLLGDNTSDQYAGLLTDQFYKDIPPYLNYFTKQWLSSLPGTKMAYLEGWQPEVADINYNVPLAYLTDESARLLNKPRQQTIQWEDVGPAGARWHGSSKTPAGEWLKASWHPSTWAEYYTELLEKLRKVEQQ